MMNIATLVLYFLAGWGTMSILRNVVIPIIDAMLFAMGGTIFYLLHIRPMTAIKHPFLFISNVLKVFLYHLANTSTYKRTSDYWVWEPYFHYRSRERKDIR